MTGIEFYEKALKELKDINLYLSRLSTMYKDFMYYEYGLDYTYRDDNPVDFLNVPPTEDGDDDD